MERRRLMTAVRQRSNTPSVPIGYSRGGAAFHPPLNEHHIAIPNVLVRCAPHDYSWDAGGRGVIPGTTECAPTW